MDITTILLIAAMGLITILVVVFMLNRAWGDFPRRVGPTDSGPSPVPSSGEPAWDAAPPDDRSKDEVEEDEALPAGAPEGGLVLVTHPLVLRAVEGALERGGSPYATYFIRHDERVYLAAYRIADPVEREQVTRVFESLNSGDLSGVDFNAVLGTLQRLGK